MDQGSYCQRCQHYQQLGSSHWCHAQKKPIYPVFIVCAHYKAGA